MDEARLAEIEAKHERLARWRDMPEEEWRVLLVDTLNEGLRLLTEVRRLRALSQSNDQAYSEGCDSGRADIVGIILDAEDDFDAMIQIKQFLGWEGD